MPSSEAPPAGRKKPRASGIYRCCEQRVARVKIIPRPPFAQATVSANSIDRGWTCAPHEFLQFIVFERASPRSALTLRGQKKRKLTTREEKGRLKEEDRERERDKESRKRGQGSNTRRRACEVIKQERRAKERKEGRKEGRFWGTYINLLPALIPIAANKNPAGETDGGNLRASAASSRKTSRDVYRSADVSLYTVCRQRRRKLLTPSLEVARQISERPLYLARRFP